MHPKANPAVCLSCWVLGLGTACLAGPVLAKNLMVAGKACRSARIQGQTWEEGKSITLANPASANGAGHSDVQSKNVTAKVNLRAGGRPAKARTAHRDSLFPSTASFTNLPLLELKFSSYSNISATIHLLNQ